MAGGKKPFQLSFLFLLLLITFPYLEAGWSNSSAGISSVGCIATERDALLKFKEGLNDPSGWLSSWVGEDCCKWMGVRCSNHTGNVLKLDLQTTDSCDSDEGSGAALYNKSCLGGMLNPSLINLTHLTYLDLKSHNFQGITIPDFIGELKNLRYLDLSRANFSGMVPPHIGNLSNLVHLDISTFAYQNYIWVSDLNWLSGLPSLQYLDLTGLNLSKSTPHWVQSVNMLPLLLELHLAGCELQDFQQSLPFVNFTLLSVLDLFNNSFSSPIPQWLFNISTLVTVSLNDCRLLGSIPKISKGNLCNLSSLDLSSNDISGEIKEFIEVLSECNNTALEELSLSENKLSGNLPNSLGSLSQIRILDLSFNMLNGTIPESVGQLTQLNNLDLLGNSWEGVIYDIHLRNLTELLYFSLSSAKNSLVFNVKHDWIPPFNLTSIAINSCQLGPAFAEWLKTQKQIQGVTLSNVGFSDTIPDWFWSLSSQIWWLDLSRNQLRGKIPRSISFGSGTVVKLGFNLLEGPIPIWSNLSSLSLRNNLFSGPIPANMGSKMSELVYLDLTCNLINGSIPPTISKMRNLEFLDLSNNNLSGAILSRWQGMEQLAILDLSNNSLSGGVPRSMCSQLRLIWLALSRNNLSGDLSSSLRNCTHLVYLDLGTNSFFGTIPESIADYFPNLSYLCLRADRLTGNIPEQLCQLPSLHILDLAHNNLSGSIPRCIGNLTALKTKEIYSKSVPSSQLPSFSLHAQLFLKGRSDDYADSVSLVNYIDLSSNRLIGEIPEGITDLSTLITLNLSRNELMGGIPENFGNLKELEILDLSFNHLSGSIPPSMSSMTFLSRLNFSYNNLSGQIPSNNQFQTFNDPSSYEGNPELCGPPLPTKCPSPNDNAENKAFEDNEENEDGSEKLWFYVSAVSGFFAGLCAVCGSLVINKYWRHAYFVFVDEMKDKLLLFVALLVARLQRKAEAEG